MNWKNTKNELPKRADNNTVYEHFKAKYVSDDEGTSRSYICTVRYNYETKMWYDRYGRVVVTPAYWTRIR